MNEKDYLNRLEDDEADRVACRVWSERDMVLVPSEANDIPIDQAVQEMHKISKGIETIG